MIPLLCKVLLLVQILGSGWSLAQVVGSVDHAVQAESRSHSDKSEVAGTATVERLIDEGLLQQAREKLKHELATRGENHKTLFLEAKILFKEKKFQESISKLDQAVVLDRSDSEVFKLIASNAILLNRLDLAEPNLKSAIRLAPNDVMSHLQLGMLYFVESRFALAESQLRQVVKLNPKLMRAHVILGLALEEQSDEEAAIRSYREAIELTDRQSLKDESAYLRLGKLFLAKSRCHDSLPLLQRAVELNPKSSEAAYLLGKNLHDLGNEVEAMSALNQSAMTDSSNPAPHYLLSRIYLKQGKAHEAQKEIEIFQTLSQTEKRAEGGKAMS